MSQRIRCNPLTCTNATTQNRLSAAAMDANGPEWTSLPSKRGTDVEHFEQAARILSCS